MKRLLLIVISFFIITSSINAQKTIKVGAFNFYPAIFLDTDGVVKGFYVDALSELEKKEDYKFIYVYGSWSDCLNWIKTGEVDLLVSVAITKERLKFLDYSETPLLTVWSEVYTNLDSEINGILDLNGKAIAVMKDDFNGNYLKDLLKKIKIDCSFIETEGFEDVFKLLSSRKVDAGVVNNTFGAAKSIDYNLSSSGIVLNPFDIYFAVKKGNNQQLISVLNRYLHSWKTDENSIFNKARQKWSFNKIGVIETFPKWFKKSIYITSSFVFILLIFIVLLRYRVKVATDKINYNEKKFSLFMDNIPANVYIKDEQLCYIYNNRNKQRFINTDIKTNTNQFSYILEPSVIQLIKEVEQGILSSKNQNSELVYSAIVDNKTAWFRDYRFYLELPNGKPAIGCLTFDITEIKTAEIEIIEAKNNAQKSDRLKSAFLANISHEIRTPMNGIMGFYELIKEKTTTPEEQNDYLHLIEKNSFHLLNILNKIIDISKIESGSETVEYSNVDLNEVVKRVYNSYIDEANEKGVALIINASEKPQYINTDGEKLFKIFIHLTENSIKYTNNGSIELGYKLESMSPNETQLIFYVKDSGIGIDDETQKYIFQSFNKGSFSYDESSGLGLGLSITKHYIAMLGGEIWFESNVNCGTIFYFTISKYKEQ